MATPRRAHGRNKQRRKLVREVAGILAGGEPTMFRWESWCRYKLRAGLCLQGTSWPRSDAIAAEIIRRALDLLNVERPPWAWGQIEYTWECGTRVEYTHCIECGSRLPDDRQKFCDRKCGHRYWQKLHYEELRVREKMNGISHPWFDGNGKTAIGAVVVNGAGVSSEKTGTHAESSARSNARTATTAANGPRSAPS